MADPSEELAKQYRDIAQVRFTLDNTPLLLENRLVLQRKWEAAYYRCAELEEDERVRRVRQEALSSGLVDCLEAQEDVGECPICLEQIPKTLPATLCPKKSVRYMRLYCCGAVYCVKCHEQRIAHSERGRDQVTGAVAGVGFLGLAHLQESLIDLRSMERCPFCRSPNEGAEHMLSLIRGHAEAGRSWAQHEMGQCSWSGLASLTHDGSQAAQWLERAVANTGNVDSLVLLAKMWTGGSDDGVTIKPSPEKAKEYWWRAARQGHWLAQCWFAGLLDTSDPNVMKWHTLSAAQGFAPSQLAVGRFFYVQAERQGPYVRDATAFKALYWFKKAALQGNADAQFGLSLYLLDVKAGTFDKIDAAGNSVLPEARFWLDLANKTGVPIPEPLRTVPIQCGCCGTQSGSIKRCSKCRGIAYCSRECQVRHWKMGHKVDCAGVEECRRALVVPCEKEYIYPVYRNAKS